MCSTILQICLQNRSGLAKTPGIDIIPLGDNTTSMLKILVVPAMSRLEFVLPFTSQNIGPCDSLLKLRLHVFIKDRIIFPADQIRLSHNPLTWLVKGWFLHTAQSIPCSNQYLPISLLWFCSAIHFPKSDSATAKLLELSQRIILTFPQLTMK